jgi:uncharacterized protein YjiS (DUF1127 family)
MPLITAFAVAAAAPLARGLTALCGRAVQSTKRLANALKNRWHAGRLAGLDDRMLADIGITRSDLRDAYAEPLWHDPTDVLARRAAERRFSRRRVAFECSADTKSRRYPCADRPAQYLM